MPQCLVGIGSNLGDRAKLLDAAVECLDAAEHTRVVGASHSYQSAPIGGPPEQSAFLNAAVLIETSLDPRALLRLTQAIEQRLGRRPHAAWSARPIDLDLLLYNSSVIAEPDLTVPHRWLAVRRFALAPAAELVGEWIHPVLGWSVERLRCHLNASELEFVGVGAEATVAAQVDRELMSLLPQHPATSSVLNSSSPIEWIGFAAAKRWLSDRFAEGRIQSLRAVLFVAPDDAGLSAELLASIVAANRCPYVISASAAPADQVRELVGAVLATLPIDMHA